MTHFKTCRHCNTVCRIDAKHGKYCNECKILLEKIRTNKSKIARYYQVIDDAEKQLVVYKNELMDRQK